MNETDSPPQPVEMPLKTNASRLADSRWGWIVALIVTALGMHGFYHLTPKLADMVGLGAMYGRYIDWAALLAAGEAWGAGFGDLIYFMNPLDILKRPHSYSNWWLVLGSMGFTREDTGWMALTLVVASIGLASVAASPRSRREYLYLALLLCSPALQLGFARANNDLVIFLLVVAVGWCVASRLPLAQFCGAFVVAFATGLKYYPIVAGGLLLAGPTRRLIVWRGVVFLALAVLVLLSVYEDTLYFSRSLPAPDGLMSVGAAGVLKRLGVMSGFAHVALGGIVGLVGWWWIDGRAEKLPRSGAQLNLESAWLIAGALILAGCFWVGMSWAYRWIFAFCLTPALLHPETAREWMRPGERQLIIWLLPVAMWSDGIGALVLNLLRPVLDPMHYAEAVWLAFQPVQWIVMVVLTVIAARFAVHEAVRFFRREI